MQTADMLGPSGIQLFVDAGAPVDDNLVNQLVKDVLVEKIRGMMGEHTAQHDEKARRSPKRQPLVNPRVISPRRKPQSTARAPSPPLRLQVSGRWAYE